jgi:hypothetical protein
MEELVCSQQYPQSTSCLPFSHNLKKGKKNQGKRAKNKEMNNLGP